jgi:hypothetical protein
LVEAFTDQHGKAQHCDRRYEGKGSPLSRPVAYRVGS